MSQKSVLITGCSEGGIGHALAQEFARHDLLVFATARNVDKLTTLKHLPNVVLLTLDVTSSSSILAAAEAVRVRTGGVLHYLVNNSGQSYVMPAADTDIDAAKRMMEVNFWGVLSMVKAFIPLMIASKGATIVNVGSLNAYLYAPWMSVYNASKAALHSFSDTLRVELAPLNIKVLTVVTGIIDTKIMANHAPFKLPKDSQYRPVEKEIKDRAEDKEGISKESPEQYAKKVVRDVLAGANGKVFRGRMASIARSMSTWLPESMFDMLLAKTVHMEKMYQTS